jgi:7-cyano-7-deazaguanine synthase
MAKDMAVVLCSGGLNSTVAARVAAAEHSIGLLHVRFGHRAAAKEAECFAAVVEAMQPEKHLAIDMPHFEQIGGNARVSRKLQIEDAAAFGDAVPNSYVPGMMGTMIGAAFNWATVIGATRIVVGVSENAGANVPRLSTAFPDFSREFLELTRQAYEVASPKRPILVESPLIDLSRAEIIKLGLRLGTPIEKTWSCISSNDEPCGACIGCATRLRGFVDAGIPDAHYCEPVGAE